MSEELKEVEEELRKELRKELDESFKSYMAFGNWVVESTEKTLEFSKEMEHMFKYRFKDVTSIKDLGLIATFITRLTEQLLYLAKLQYKTMVEFKEASFYMVYLPVYTTLKFSEKTLPPIGERLKAFENEIERLKKEKKEVKIEISQEYEETFKWLEEQMKAWKRGKEVAERMKV